MASGGSYFSIPGLVASATLAAAQYKCVKHASTAGQVIVGAAATDNVIGILQNDPAAGEPALIACSGVALALSEDTVAAGDSLASSTTGRVKTTTSANNGVVGMALEAGSAGDLIQILISISNY